MSEFTREQLEQYLDDRSPVAIRLAAYALTLLDRAEKAENELEQTRVQLAGCSTAAQGYGKECKQGDYGWSAAFDDVQKLYDTLTAARLVVEAARKAARHMHEGYGPLKDALRAYDDTLKGEKEPLEINTETVTGALDAIRKAVKKL